MKKLEWETSGLELGRASETVKQWEVGSVEMILEIGVELVYIMVFVHCLRSGA